MESVLIVMICQVEYIAPPFPRVLLILEFYRGEKNREKIVVPEVHVYDSECVQETHQWSEKVLFIHSAFTQKRCFKIVFNYNYKNKMTVIL